MNERIRQIAVACQGLHGGAAFGRGIDGAMAAIERLGHVQIDTLSVVERAHHHILWSRVPDYRSGMLNSLIAERRIFEYWAHAAAYLPMRDYRYALPRMRAVRSGANRYYASADPKLMAAIVDRIRDDGPLRMRDFNDDGAPRSGSWNWGPVRRAFDRLFMQGDLMVAERRGMEKLFDLTERWLPAGIDDRLPDAAELARHLFDGALAAHGAIRRDQLSYSRPGKAVVAALDAEIARRLADGELIEVPGTEGPPYFVPPALFEARSDTDVGAVRILSPFDNLVIHRDRLAQLFGLHYRLECYVPEAKRRFGYFCLPLLYRTDFAGLADCKADRAARRLIVVALHLARDHGVDASFVPALANGLRLFARFNGCDAVEIAASVRGLHGEVATALASDDSAHSSAEPG